MKIYFRVSKERDNNSDDLILHNNGGFVVKPNCVDVVVVNDDTANNLPRAIRHKGLFLYKRVEIKSINYVLCPISKNFLSELEEVKEEQFKSLISSAKIVTENDPKIYLEWHYNLNL
jgi:hypothetical protein